MNESCARLPYRCGNTLGDDSERNHEQYPDEEESKELWYLKPKRWISVTDC